MVEHVEGQDDEILRVRVGKCSILLNITTLAH